MRPFSMAMQLIVQFNILAHLFQIPPLNYQQTPSQNAPAPNGDPHQKPEESYVIPPPYAVPHPGTMVIESRYADVARIAVLGPRRTEYVAGGAVAVAGGAGVDGYSASGGDGVGRRGWTVRRGIWRNDSRIGDGSFPQVINGEYRRQDGEVDYSCGCWGCFAYCRLCALQIRHNKPEIKTHAQHQQGIGDVKQWSIRSQHDFAPAQKDVIAHPSFFGYEGISGSKGRKHCLLSVVITARKTRRTLHFDVIYLVQTSSSPSRPSPDTDQYPPTRRIGTRTG